MILPLGRVALGDGLGGAGLARDVQAREPRRRPGALLDDRGQGVPEKRPHHRRELHPLRHLAGGAVGQGAVRLRHALHEAGLPQDAAVGHRSHHPRDLERGHQQLALPDGHVHGVPGLPRALAPRAGGRERHEPESLAAQVDAGRRAQAEGLRVPGHRVAADLEAGLVEVDVARLGDGGAQVHVAVPARLPVLERPVTQAELPVAVDPVHRGERALLEPGRGHDDLEHRAGRVLPLQGAVHERGHRVLHQAQPLVAVDVPGEAIERERGTRRQGQHVAVARIQDDHRAGLARHRLLGDLLDPAIDGGDDLGSRIRLLAAHHLHRPAHGVDLDPLAPVPATQVLVQESLQARLPDHVPAAVAPLLHLLVAHLADVTQQVGRERAGGIHALRLDLHDHARQLELALLHLGDVLEREPPPHAHRTDRVGRHALQRLHEVADRHLQEDGQARHHRVAVLHLPRDQGEGERRAVVHQRQAVAVEEDAAGRRHRAHPDAVLLRQLLHAAAFEHLEVPELADQADEADRGDHREGEHATAPGFASTSRRRAQRHARLRTSSKLASARMQRVPIIPL